MEMDSVMAAPDAPPPVVVLVSAGASHSVALLTGNALCSWGRGEDGQLGHGDVEDRLVPTVLSGFDAPGITSVICGADHTTAYSEEELQVYSWGWGDFGRLGHGNSSDVVTPQPVKALQGLKIKQIACGDSHCLAVTMAGEVQSWGRNQNGQLGLGTTEDSLLPQKIQAFEGVRVKMIAAGAEHTAAVTEDGDLYGWGWGRYGNLGLGDRNDRLLPEKVSSVEAEKMVLIACGWRHTVTVSESGNLYTYGWSKYGQLGHGDFEDHLVPHKLEALKDSTISQISGGWRHTMALTAEGKLYGLGKLELATMMIIVPQYRFIFQRNRNTPVLIDAISPDGSGCKKLESSTAAPFTAKVWVSPSERYAIVPDENVPKSGEGTTRGNGADANVPENDVKRMRVQS
ncbi:Ultraviolet-B receptor UVR8 [Dichanthelium oligosanthes]|uniref:Ultraviolet-B receptor UVR8 n=1 Tax=Dichanthelium oligosanthes TaxID=888268 RepID=A0A1E5VXW5_9POAL|nr:Ultraviolet-B receptor UVR8 [Dichanthelium oligosanthes]